MHNETFATSYRSLPQSGHPNDRSTVDTRPGVMSMYDG